jgi:hypothetical protein
LVVLGAVEIATVGVRHRLPFLSPPAAASAGLPSAPRET